MHRSGTGTMHDFIATAGHQRSQRSRPLRRIITPKESSRWVVTPVSIKTGGTANYHSGLARSITTRSRRRCSERPDRVGAGGRFEFELLHVRRLRSAAGARPPVAPELRRLDGLRLWAQLDVLAASW